MSQLSKRIHIRILLDGKKHSIEEISRLVGVSIKTVYNVNSSIKSGVGIKHKKGAGRPSKLIPQIKKFVAKSISLDPTTSIRTLTSKSPVIISRDIVHRCLRNLEYSKPYPVKIPMLSEKNRLYRVEWAKCNMSRRWEHSIFADEASIWLSRGRVRMWTKKGQIRLQPTCKHTQKIHIWAAFSSVGTFPLCIFTQNLDSSLFTKILEVHLLAQAKVFHNKEWVLVMDNDPKHTSKATKAWMNENMPNRRLEWPSQSPDVNPIENLFGWIKNELSKRSPKNISALKSELNDIWSNIDPVFLEPYWSSMPKRCRLLIDGDGYKIDY